jgi:ubiquinone/menaquinone biosynthesis C-methylase UbiE
MKDTIHSNETGKSSFDKIDTEKVFKALDLKKDSVFLDVGCGRGDYLLAAADYIGDKGFFYAIDKWEEGISKLKERADRKKIKNLEAVVGDISKNIPFENNSVDICLMAAVLHGLLRDKVLERTIQELKRVLKRSGRLAIIEWKKISGPPGPPIGIRVSWKEAAKFLEPYGFEIIKKSDVGEYFYLALFKQR